MRCNYRLRSLEKTFVYSVFLNRRPRFILSCFNSERKVSDGNTKVRQQELTDFHIVRDERFGHLRINILFVLRTPKYCATRPRRSNRARSATRDILAFFKSLIARTPKTQESPDICLSFLGLVRDERFELPTFSV